jgi:N-acetylmuramoyl-L-alanine amidase
MILAVLNTGIVPEDYSQKEMVCVTQAVYHESANQSYIGKVGVAWVIKNRMESGLFPGTACSVVFQKTQFSNINEMRTSKRDFYGTPYYQVYDSAIAALEVFDNRIADPTHGALFFVNLKTAKYTGWLKGARKTAKLGDHTFYTKKGIFNESQTIHRQAIGRSQDFQISSR